MKPFSPPRFRVLPTLAMVLAIGSTSTAMAQVAITNIEPGTTVRYPVVALRGTASSNTVAIGAEWSTAVKFPVVAGKWAGFVVLKPGENMVKALGNKTTLKFRLDYKPMTNPYRVSTVFVLGSDSPEQFYSTRPNEKFEIREKLDVMMKLLQSATAESMNAAGFGRQTFNLELDAAGKVDVHFVRLPKTSAEMRAMENNASWGYIYDQLKSQLGEDRTHWAGLLAFTDYDPTTRKAVGTYALGGGSLALFGAGTMQWFPSRWSDVPTAMADSTILDPGQVLEDSAGRQAVWANVSTGFGALLHELGHTFGLPHSPDGTSVMSRGFDYFSRWLTIQDPPSQHSATPVAFTAEGMMKWDPFFAKILSASPFFQADGPAGTPTGSATITVEGDKVVLQSPDGVLAWGAIRDDLPHVWKATNELPRTVTLSLADLRSQLKTDKEFSIVLLDKFGRTESIVQKP